MTPNVPAEPAASYSLFLCFIIRGGKRKVKRFFLFGALMTVLPMLAAFWIAKRWRKLSTMNALGSLCGGMTSTPALGTLIAVAGSDAVAVAYAATYPAALILVVLLTQLIAVLG